MELYSWVDEVINLSQAATDPNTLLNLLTLSSGRSIFDLASFTRQSKHLPNLRFSISSTLGMAQEHTATNMWYDFLSNHLLYLANRLRGSDPRSTFDTFNQGFAYFTKVYKLLPEGRWSAPLIKWFCCELYTLAKAADRESESSGKKTVCFNEAVRSIQQLFAICQSSSQDFPDSKLYCVMYCINMLFKIFFNLDMIQSCQTLVKWYEQNQSKIVFEEYPMSVQATFKYFAGRMALYQMEIVKAEENLQFVFMHCHKKSFKNRRLAIRYLTPAKMLLGTYPSEELLKKYQLKEYIEISRAVRTGNLKKFNEELAKYEELYISKGVYLVMDKLRAVTYRNLFKKVVKILLPTGGPLKLEEFNKSVQWMLSDPMDPLETECILANMIHQGFLRAYISHEKQMVVMSKKNDIFPAVRSIYPSSAK